jgi:hypothetical protein
LMLGLWGSDREASSVTAVDLEGEVA